MPPCDPADPATPCHLAKASVKEISKNEMDAEAPEYEINAEASEDKFGLKEIDVKEINAAEEKIDVKETNAEVFDVKEIDAEAAENVLNTTKIGTNVTTTGMGGSWAIWPSSRNYFATRPGFYFAPAILIAPKGHPWGYNFPRCL